MIFFMNSLDSGAIPQFKTNVRYEGIELVPKDFPLPYQRLSYVIHANHKTGSHLWACRMRTFPWEVLRCLHVLDRSDNIITVSYQHYDNWWLATLQANGDVQKPRWVTSAFNRRSQRFILKAHMQDIQHHTHSLQWIGSENMPYPVRYQFSISGKYQPDSNT